MEQKIFHDKQKLEQYMNTKPPLQRFFKQNNERTGNTKPQEKKRQGTKEKH
jgi:hypothetical protein